jgi:hypothetical protein
MEKVPAGIQTFGDSVKRRMGTRLTKGPDWSRDDRIELDPAAVGSTE